MNQIDIKAKAQEVYEKGFCVLEAVYTEEEQAGMRKVLDGCWVANGSPAMPGFGFAIHPLMVKAPGCAPYFANPVVIDAMSEVLQDDVRLMHAGSRISNEDSVEQIGWHEHYAWDPAGLLGRDKVERILANIYVDGCSEGSGNLIVYPRAMNDPLGEPRGDSNARWPGEIVVDTPPGSVVIFCTALRHTAVRGSRPGFRHLFGGHYQGWNYEKPHREDNPCNVREVERYKEQFLRFRSLVAKT